MKALMMMGVAGALLALRALRGGDARRPDALIKAVSAGVKWLLDLQNRDAVRREKGVSVCGVLLLASRRDTCGDVEGAGEKCEGERGEGGESFHGMARRRDGEKE